MREVNDIEHSRLIFGNFKLDQRMQPKTTKNRLKS